MRLNAEYSEFANARQSQEPEHDAAFAQSDRGNQRLALAELTNLRLELADLFQQQPDIRLHVFLAIERDAGQRGEPAVFDDATVRE